MIGKCAKQTVTATLIADNGKRYVGTNYCLNPQEVCPRKGMKTGEGYELCESICKQRCHAEINAIIEAGFDAVYSTIYLEGHTYACDKCKSYAKSMLVKEIIIGKPPEEKQ